LGFARKPIWVGDAPFMGTRWFLGFVYRDICFARKAWMLARKAFGAARKVNHPARKVFCSAGRAFELAGRALWDKTKVGMVADKALRMGRPLR
jgi:hypothetical protein